MVLLCQNNTLTSLQANVKQWYRLRISEQMHDELIEIVEKHNFRLLYFRINGGNCDHWMSKLLIRNLRHTWSFCRSLLFDFAVAFLPLQWPALVSLIVFDHWSDCHAPTHMKYRLIANLKQSHLSIVNNR